MGLNNITHDRCRGPNLARSGGLGWLDVRDGVVCARARRCVCVSGLGRWRQRPSARSHHSTVRCPPFTRRPNDRPEIWRMATECRVRKPSSPPPTECEKNKEREKKCAPPSPALRAKRWPRRRGWRGMGRKRRRNTRESAEAADAPMDEWSAKWGTFLRFGGSVLLSERRAVMSCCFYMTSRSIFNTLT